MQQSNLKREEYIQKIKEFCLFDDDFMSRVFDENIECTQLILRIILERDDVSVKEVHTQYEIKNLFGHSVRFDIKAEDAEGNPIDIEIQRSDKGAGVKRARYNSSLLDANTLVKGEEYESLPESYVIFITENDVMGKGFAVYQADRIIRQTGEGLGDGTHIIYVNGAYKDKNSAVGKLMHDFSCTSANDMYYEPLAQQVRYYKEDVKGVDAMCRIMEELIDDEKREITIRLIKKGVLPNEAIAECVGLDVEIVNALENELKAATY